MTGLIRRGAVYWLRVRVPTDIVEVANKKEVCKSLKTKDLNVARQRLSIERLKLEAEFEKARRKKLAATGVAASSHSEVSHLNPEEIYRIVICWFHEVESRASSSDTELLGTAAPLELRDMITDLRQDETSLIEEAEPPRVDAEQSNWSQRELDSLLAKHGITLPITHPQYALIKRLIIRGLTESIRRRASRLSGQIIPAVDDPYFSTIFAEKPLPEHLTATKKPISVTELSEKFIIEQAPKKLRPKTIDLYRVIARDFASVVGEDTAISVLGREDFVKFRDILQCVPANATKRFPKLSLQQVANLAQEQGIEPMAAKTVNKKLEFLSTLFKYAYNCDLVTKNHASGLSVPDEKKKKERVITVPQLTAIFGAPLYIGCIDDEKDYAKSGNARPRRGRFWVPLIALFSGMRLNEICQLYAQDIKCSDGIDYFDVRESLDDEASASDKRVKTENAERRVPIHPELRRIGFLHFVAAARKNGHDRLFPELKLAATGNYSDIFQKWFRRFLRQIKSNDVSAITFHWFRHTFREALSEAQVSTEFVNRLCGWQESDGMASHYGRGPSLGTLYNEISKVAYRGLDLNHLDNPPNG